MSDIPDDWKQLPLGEIGELSTSSVDKKTSPLEATVRLVNYMDVYRHDRIDSELDLMLVTATNAERLRSQVRMGDILFTPSSETPDDIGHSAVVSKELPNTLHSYHTVRLRPADLDAFEVRFLGRVATNRSTLRHFRQRATGSTRYTLSLGDFRSAPIRVPPLPEQRGIAEILDTVDGAIQRTEELIAKLEKMKKGLLQDLLTRGIDENGELRDPERHPEQFKDSPLGRIPRDWEGPFRLDELEATRTVELGRGDVISAIDMAANPGPYPVYSSSASGSGEFGRYGRYMFDEELITWSVDGGGRPFYRPKHRYSVTNVCGYLRILTPKDWDYQFLHAMMAKQHAQRTFDYQLKAHPSVIRELYWFLRPSRVEQRRITGAQEAHASRIAKEHAAIAKLRSLKQGLMDDLLTGRVRVNVAEPEAVAV